MHLPFVRRWCALAATAVTMLTACSDQTRPVQLPPPSLASSFAGDGQHGQLGVELPVQIAVRVTDDGGRPIAGRSVSFRGDTGSVFEPKSTSTDANGVASTHWILGPVPGTQRAIALVDGANSVVFTASAEHGTPSIISVTPDTVLLTAYNQTVPLLLTLRDADNRPIGDVTLSWVSNSPQMVSVDALGVLRAGTAVGTTTVVVVAPSATHGIIADTAYVRVQRTPQSLYTIPDSTNIPVVGGFTTVSAVVRATDGFNISNADVTWSTLTPSLVTLAPNGLQTRVTAAAKGRALVVASYAGFADTTVVRIP